MVDWGYRGTVMKPESLFSLSEHPGRLSEDGDPLEVLDATVDFEYFRGWLVAGLGYGDGSKGGWDAATTDCPRSSATSHISASTGNTVLFERRL